MTAAVVLVGILAAWSPAAGRGAEPGPERSLAALAASYRSGERDEAVAALGFWTQAETEREAERLIEGLRQRAARSKASTAEPVVCAAVALMSDAALAALKQVAPRRARWQLASAARLAHALPAPGGPAGFSARFHAVAGRMLLFMGDLAGAHEMLSEGRRRAGEDAELLLGLGAVIETVGALRTYERPETSRPLGAPDEPRFVIEGEEGAGGRLPRTRLADAQAALGKALQRDPGLLEARLRLGRVLLLRGKPEDALAELAKVGQGSPSPAASYMAQMLEGRCRERLGDARGAAAAYSAAHESAPRAQAALIALGRALDRLGEGPRAQEAFRDALLPELEPDPWLDYLRGQPDRIDGLVGELRVLAP